MTTAKLRTTEGLGRRFDSILDTIGNTPTVRVNNLGPKGAAALAEGLKGNSTLQSLE